MAVPDGGGSGGGKKKRLRAFHLALDEEGPLPFEYFISRLCEEFNCPPSVAWREWLELPVGFMEQIIEYRNYAGAKRMYESASTPEARKRLPLSPMLDLVKATTFALVQEEIAQRP